MKNKNYNFSLAEEMVISVEEDLKDIFNAIQNVRGDFPTLEFILKLLDSEALEMTKGGPEFKYSKEWLDIFWPVDEYIFI